MHRFFETLDTNWLKTMRALQFSWDRTLNRSWFGSFEASYFGKSNSIDVQTIERADGSYDFLYLSHVMEAVPDDRRAMKELARVLSPDGVLAICFGTTVNRTETEDYPGGPGTFGNRRHYGSDRFKRLSTANLGLITIEVEAADPTTGTLENVDLFVKSPIALSFILRGDSRILSPTHYLLNATFGQG